MPEVVVAKARTGKFNKNAARRVRAAGKIPAVLYGPGADPVAVELDEASPDEAKSLAEEGIEFHPLPVLPDERN